MRSLLFIILTLIPALAEAQAVRVDAQKTKQVCQNGYCRLVKTNNVGSGVIVGRCEGYSYILTAAHVVVGSSRVTAHKVPAEVVAVRNDQEADIALLKVAYDFGEEFISPIGSDPVEGQPLMAHGFTGDTGYSVNRLRLQGTSSPSWNRGHVVSGYSGGAVTSDRSLVGIISGVTARPGEDGKKTWITPTSLCLPFLHRHCPCFSSRRVQKPQPEVKVITQDTTKLENSVSVLLARIDSLEKKIDTLQREPGPVGPQGPVGPAGADGRNGRDGKDASVDESKLVEAIMKRLPPIPASFSIQPLN
jgi:hypothetical protein